MDLTRHIAKEDAKAEKEAPAATKDDPSLSKAKINQVAIKGKQVLHPGGLHRTTGQAGP